MSKINLPLSSLCAALMLTVGAPAFADSTLDSLQNLGQAEFSLFAKDFISAGSYKAVAPGEPLGITGFDIGLEVSSTKLTNPAIWKKAGVDLSSLPLPKLHIHKGLPFNIDVAASMVAVPSSNIKLVGMEIRYALLEGGVATPSLSIRAAGSSLTGVDQLDLNTKSIELTLSKGFLMLTPYIGVGRVNGTATPNVASLKKVTTNGNKVFAGLNANFGLMNFAAEADRTGDNDTISVKMGFRF